MTHNTIYGSDSETAATMREYGFTAQQAGFLVDCCEWDFDDAGWIQAALEMLDGVGMTRLDVAWNCVFGPASTRETVREDIDHSGLTAPDYVMDAVRTAREQGALLPLNETYAMLCDWLETQG